MKAVIPPAGNLRMLRNPLCLIALATSLAAEPPPMATTGLSPTDALQRMKVPAGFEVDLIAAEPDVMQPIAMCFDARGRLWVAEGLTYPKRAPEGQGQDKLLIFEDTNGDGKFDSRKVFAEGMNLVSGLEAGFGGVFVGAAPYLLFIPDRNGDDKPDSEPQILLDGFGYEDTHETLNSFVWGPDGWLWGCHGVFTNSRVGKPGSSKENRVPLNAGVWRMNPVNQQFEVVSHGTSNPWGLDFNDWGDAFVEACVIPHLWHMIPGGHYQRQAGADFNPAIYDPIRTIADHAHWTGNIADHAHWGHEGGISAAVSDAGGGHAHSGFVICLTDAFPPEFRNDALFFNIHGHRLNHDELVRNASGWTGQHGKDLLMTYDQWFLGVSIHPGPDGAMYFNDWYDATTCHRPDPERWDRSNGRIYRLRAGEHKPWRGDLNTWTDLQLAETHAGRNEWEIRMARKVLQERISAGKSISAEAKSALRGMLANHADETRRLRSLWTLRACGLLTADDVTGLLKAKGDFMRSWAVRISAEDQLATRDLTALAGTESSPVVMLALCSAMQRIAGEQALEIAGSLAPRIDPKDPNLSRMLWFGIERCVPENPASAIKLAFDSPDGKLLEWTTRRMNPGQALESLCAALKQFPSRRDEILNAIRLRLELRPEEKLTAAQGAQLATLDTGGSPVARELAARAGDPGATDQLWIVLLDEKADLKARKSALKVLSTLPAAEDLRWRRMLESPTLRLETLEARPVLLDLPEVDPLVSGFTADQKARAARLAIRANRQARLIEWLNTGRLRKPEVPADVVARLREVKDDTLRQAVTGIFGEERKGAAERQKAIASWKIKLTPEVLAKADVANGRAVFDRTCASCHQLFGEGGQVGPELTGGDRGTLNHWLDNILDPNALIGAGYELHQLTRKDGGIVTGMLASESDTEYTLKLVGQETRISKKDVADDKPLGISMMPEGLLDNLTESQVADLIKYLGAPSQVKID